jgi:hypothetical protein
LVGGVVAKVAAANDGAENAPATKATVAAANVARAPRRKIWLVIGGLPAFKKDRRVGAVRAAPCW